MPREVRSGVVLAGFRVQGPVAEGAMGAVYRAEDCSTGAQVALKVLLPELARDERFRQRFLRETGIAASLDHPNVIRTVAAGDEDGRRYRAVQYLDGPALRELLRREGEFEPERAIRLVEQVAAGLDSAHEAGLDHRDVKPGNVLVRQEEEGEHAYICDFGLARHVSSVSSLTGERGFIGTIAYVPPEQIEGGEIDGRADVYSLGCVLFECLAGTPPFARDSELSVVFAHLNEPPPRLSDQRPDLPEAFDAVFATALAKSPDDRYDTCGELAQAARAALAGKVVARRRVRRRRLAVAAAATLLTAAAIAAALVATGGTSRSKRVQIALAPNAVSLIDARSHRIVGSVPYGATNVVFAGRSAWLLSPNKQQLARVDLRTHKVDRRLDFLWHPGTLTTGDGSVWIAEDLGSRVWRIDAASGKVARRMRVSGGGISDVAFGAGSLWLAQGDGVLRADPRAGHVLKRIAAPAQQLVFGDGALWTVTHGDGRLA